MRAATPRFTRREYDLLPARVEAATGETPIRSEQIQGFASVPDRLLVDV